MSILRDIKIIEALLFASGKPVLEQDLKDKIINKKEFNSYIKEIQNFYKDRGIQLIKSGVKWSFTTAPDVSDDLIIFKTMFETRFAF